MSWFDRNGTPQVYFMRPVGMEGPIKIGYSRHARSRLAALSNWSPVPLEIVLVIDGTSALEKNIHDCFADSHSHREWFHASPRLLAAIEAMKSGVPVEQAIDLSAPVGSVSSAKIRDAKARRGTSQETYAL